MNNFLQMIEVFEVLNFDRKRLDCFDVNLAVIENFKCCKPLQEYDGYNDLPDDIKNEVNKQESIKNECLDVLGVYIAPTKDDNANILLSKEKIFDVAEKYKIKDDCCFYHFVKIHEYAHASMCTQLWNIGKYNKDARYVIIEESLATAIALKMMNKVDDYNKLESFVSSQPFEYRYGLKLLKEHSDCIEDLMVIWKLAKSCLSCEIKTELDMLNLIISGGFDKSSLEVWKNKLVGLLTKKFIETNKEHLLNKDFQDMFIF